ncbi:DUF2254 domain-containing protein [Blastococcus saxobsidens]|uniref:DUF2254 domain-containing protein n=1 Tax=Blastococcus saxobsidens TaxID=138336 RepID=A0A6L9W5N5_9ACTN|nr:DUF2254 domain-containing protein [Blastococcus saxobsidens]NEK86751.1 DUF2254 domain-containing protein [Blastococcus saxobsidens]
MSPTGALRQVRNRLSGALWPVPALAIVLAVGLGVTLPALDGLLGGPGDDNPLTFAFGGGPSAARDVLAAIAGSLISVTGLTFSFTVVALQLSSSQHSPRLLQTFVTDRVVQATLGVLVGTFVYALTVLRTVRTEGADDVAFVPRLSVTVAFGLTVISVMALVLFLGHLARSLRVETMLRDVSDEARATFARELPEAGSEPASARAELPSGPPRPVLARSSGFVVDVDGPRIAEAAERAGATVLLAHRIGDSVVAGTPIAHAWPAAPGSAVDLDAVGEALAEGVRLSFERTPDRDVAYSLRKTVDITGRALSPGSNDPTTAVHGLSHVSALLGELVSCPLDATPFRDEDGVLRFVLPQWTAEELVRLGIEEPIQYAGGQPAVLRRLAGLLRELAWRAPRGSLDETLRTRLDQVVALAEESTSIDRAETTLWRTHLSDALAGRWTVQP